jgi:hypothetical protein
VDEINWRIAHFFLAAYNPLRSGFFSGNFNPLLA